MAGDGTKYGTGDAEVDSRGVPIVALVTEAARCVSTLRTDNASFLCPTEGQRIIREEERHGR